MILRSPCGLRGLRISVVSFSAVILLGIFTAVPAAPAHAQAAPAPADRAVYLDKEGVVRWKDDRREVTLFGANYVLPTASDYRAAGYLHADRKRMIDEDMAQFARMGWDGLRLTFWGDWEASDSAGNLIANDHLDLQDYLIARARERGIYMLFSPIQLYGSNWPDALGDTTAPGFGRRFGKERMGTDPAALAAQVNYLRQILDHVNPYTGVALKDEPAILFIELVNEPAHHPEDLEGSIRYINALTDAVRRTGCRKLVFYNVSQDFRIAEAIRRSQGAGGDLRLVSHRGSTRAASWKATTSAESMPSPTCCARSWPVCRASCTSSTAPTCGQARCTPRWRGPFARWARSSPPCSPTTCCGPPPGTSAGRPTT